MVSHDYPAFVKVHCDFCGVVGACLGWYRYSRKTDLLWNKRKRQSLGYEQVRDLFLIRGERESGTCNGVRANKVHILSLTVTYHISIFVFFNVALMINAYFPFVYCSQVVI